MGRIRPQPAQTSNTSGPQPVRNIQPGLSGMQVLARRGNNLFFFPMGQSAPTLLVARSSVVAQPSKASDAAVETLVFPSLDTSTRALVHPFDLPAGFEAKSYIDSLSFSDQGKAETVMVRPGSSGSSFQIPLTLSDSQQSAVLSLAEIQLKLLLTQIGLRALPPKAANEKDVVKVLDQNYQLISKYVEPLIAKFRNDPGNPELISEFLTVRRILMSWDKNHPVEPGHHARANLATVLPRIKIEVRSVQAEGRSFAEGLFKKELGGRHSLFQSAKHDRLGEDMGKIPGVGDNTTGIAQVGDRSGPSESVGDIVDEVEWEEPIDDIEVANFGLGNQWHQWRGNWDQLDKNADKGDEDAKERLIDTLLNDPDRFTPEKREELLEKYGQDPEVLKRFVEGPDTPEVKVKLLKTLFEQGNQNALDYLLVIVKTGNLEVFEYLIERVEETGDEALFQVLLANREYLDPPQLNVLIGIIQERITRGEVDLLSTYRDLVQQLQADYNSHFVFLMGLYGDGVEGALDILFGLIRFERGQHESRHHYNDGIINFLLDLEGRGNTQATEILALLPRNSVNRLRAERNIVGIRERLATSGRISDEDLAMIAEYPQAYLRDKDLVQAILERYDEGSDVARDILNHIGNSGIYRHFGFSQRDGVRQSDEDRRHVGIYADYLVEMITEHDREDLIPNLFGGRNIDRLPLESDEMEGRIDQVVDYYKDRAERENSREALIILFNMGRIGWRKIKEISEGDSPAKDFALELVETYTRYFRQRQMSGFGSPRSEMEGLMDIANLSHNPFVFSNEGIKYVMIRNSDGEITVNIGGSHHRDLYLNEGDAIAAGYITYDIENNTITIDGGSRDFPTYTDGIINNSGGSYPVARENGGLNAAAEYLRGRFPGVTVTIK